MTSGSPLDLYVEEGELSDDQDVTVTEQDQSISEEQTYRVFTLSRAGLTSQILTVQPTLLMTTPLPDLKLQFPGKCQFRCQQKTGYVESLAN